MEVFMQSAIYGMYKDGQIIFDEPDININSSRVLVVFLEDDPGNKNSWIFSKYMDHGKIIEMLKLLSLIYKTAEYQRILLYYEILVGYKHLYLFS
jgi:hypothetical protein